MEFRIKFLPGEYFWGGSTANATDMPISQSSGYCRDYRTNPVNQMTPLFISSKGRYVWSDRPFKVWVENEELCFDGGEFELAETGGKLREAYLDAMKKHFPFSGKTLPHEFFKTAQYNTWMEFTYDPTQKGVLEYAHAIIEHGFEPGILIIDEGWHTRYGLWEFDFAKFHDPKAMVDELHSLGFIVMLWVTPLMTPDGVTFVKTTLRESVFDDGSGKKLFLRNKEGRVALVNWWNGCSAILDFRKECDREFMGSRLNALMRDYGVDGFKFDGGSYGMYHPSNLVNGTPCDDMDPIELNRAWNEFGAQYRFHEYKDTYNGGGRAMIQRLCDRGHRWDKDGINTLLPSALLQGIMGYPFICPDMVGGGEWTYNFMPGFKVDEELFIRMAQASALYPMMQFSWAPWRALSEGSYKLVAKAAQLHKSMANEIIALVDESAVSGEPVIRSLEYVDPGQGYETITDEFLLGNDILVCPIVTKGTFEKVVIFPEGRWQDEDGSIFEGRSAIKLPSPIEKLLWFRRIK